MLDAGYRMLYAEVRSLLMLEMLIAELLIDRLDTTNEVINNEFLEAGKGVQHPVIGNE